MVFLSRTLETWFPFFTFAFPNGWGRNHQLGMVQKMAKMGNHMSYYQAYTQPYTPENEPLDTKIPLTLEENPKFQGKWMILRIPSVSFQECSLSPTIMVQWKMDGLVRTQFSLSMIIGRKKNNMEKRTWLSGWNLTMGYFGVKSNTKWEYHYGNLYWKKPNQPAFHGMKGICVFLLLLFVGSGVHHEESRTTRLGKS